MCFLECNWFGMGFDWSDVSFVKRSKYRREVVSVIDEEMTPTELADETGLQQPHISRALGELKEKEIVELLNPEDKMGRLYRLTDKGREIRGKL